MTCARPGCFGLAVGNLCRRCESLRDAAFIVTVCGVVSALIVVAVKVFG